MKFSASNKLWITFTIQLLICVFSVRCYYWEQLINASKLNNYKDILPVEAKFFDSLLSTANVSAECVSSIQSTIKLLKEYDSSALKLVNSWGKFPPTGLLSGTVTDFGDYDQCLSITQEDLTGKAQYCLVDIGLPLPPVPKHQNMYHVIENLLPKNFTNLWPNNVLTLLSKEASIFYWVSMRIGICTPDKCQVSDIISMVKSECNRIGLEFKNVECETANKTSLNFMQIIAILILGISFVLSIVASIVEQNSRLKESSVKLIVTAFSITNNIKKLMSTKTNYELSCLSGLRVLTVVWVIYGHTVAWNDMRIFSQTFRIKNELSALDHQFFLKAYNSVETFFFLSGMLTSYVTFKQTKEKYENFSSLVFVLGRYIRLTPQLAIFILLTTLIPLMGSGPVWNQWITPLVDNCYSNWWQNLIYMQNIIDAKNMCALHTWYIATDMQYHWLSLVVIMALLYCYEIGAIITTIVASLFFILSAIIIFLFDLAPGYVNTGKSEFYLNFYDPMFYWKPWSHGSVFFIGLGFGYFAYKQKPITLTISKKLLIWLGLSLGYIIAIYDVQYWLNGAPFNRWISALLYPTTRVIWSANTAVLIWMCMTGNGGVINKFLSWKPFIPLSRLTYSVYLTHAWSVWIYMGSRRQLIEPNVDSIRAIFFNHIFVSFFVGTVFSLLFEAPFLIFFSYLLKKKQRKKMIEPNENNNVALLNITSINGKK